MAEAMNDRRGHTDCVGKRGRFVGNDEPADQVTVAAVIDPATGTVISRGVSHHENQTDETMAIANPDKEAINTCKQVAEYIPDAGRCAKHDKTVMWVSKDPPNLRRVAGRLASYHKKLGRKGRFVVAVGFLILLIAGMVGTICGAGESEKERHVLPVPVRSEAPISPPSPSSKPIVTGAPISIPASVISSKMAADALVEGRLDEALKHYGELKAVHPQKQSYALIVDILTASEKARTP